MIKNLPANAGDTGAIPGFTWGMVHVWTDTSVQILGSKTGGRLFCYTHIQE